MLATAERWREMPAIERVSSGVALTFDDGPDADCTPPVLDALDAAGVKATFFLVGEQLMRNHAIARETAARGHELALHGYEHVEHDSLRPQAARDDLARALGAFEAATGRGAGLFRRPGRRGAPSLPPRRTAASPMPPTTPAATSASSPCTGRAGGWTGRRSRRTGSRGSVAAARARGRS